MSELSPLALLAGLLLVTPFLGSLSVWVWTFAAPRDHQILYAPRADPLPRQQRLYLFFAGSLLIMSQLLIGAALSARSDSQTPDQAAAEKAEAEEPSPKDELRRIQIACGSATMVACVGLMVIFALPTDERILVGFRSNELGRQSLAGGLGFLAALLPVYLTIVATLPLRSEESQHQLLQLLDGKPGFEFVFWISLQAILLAPLAEEMLYRVLLQGGLVQAGYKPAFAIPIVAVFFCANHGFPDMIPLLPLALILGWVYHLRNSYVAVVLIHMLFNAFNVALQILGTYLKDASG